MGETSGAVDTSLAESVVSLRALVRGLSEVTPDGAEMLRELASKQLPPGHLANILASALMGDADKRQLFLETPNVHKRVEIVTHAVVQMMSDLTCPDAAN